MSQDRREEFADRYWQQGRLLATPAVREWTLEQCGEANRMERCCAFVNFHADDLGRSREFVYRWPTPEEAAAAIDAHNEQLRQQHASQIPNQKGTP